MRGAVDAARHPPRRSATDPLSSTEGPRGDLRDAARPNARFETIERRGRPIGRLIVDRRDDEIHLVDITLLPASRGRGIGGALIVELCREGARGGQPVRLQVERRNPALRLYRRLGFVEIGDENVYALMEWAPGPAAAPEVN